MHRRLHFSPQLWDRAARRVITGGGLLIVLAVLGIVLFIAREAAPLFGRPRSVPTPVASPPDSTAWAAALATGTDDGRALGFLVLPGATVFFRLADGGTLATVPHAFADSTAATCASVDPKHGLVAFGTADGRAALAELGFESSWRQGGAVVSPHLRWRGLARLDVLARPVERVAADRDEDGRVALAGILAGGGVGYALLDDEGALSVRRDLGEAIPDHDPASLTLSLRGQLLVAGTRGGTLYLWKLDDPAAPELEDHVRVATSGITALACLLGEQTLVTGTEHGDVATWMRVRYVRAENRGERAVEIDGEPLLPGEERTVLDRDWGRRLGHVPGLRFATAGRPWTHARDFGRHPAAVVGIAAGPRGRIFATADAQGGVHLHHATSGRTLLELAAAVGGPWRGIAFAPKADGLVALAGDGRVHAWRIDAPHPESTLGTLLERVWYEGYSEPKHVWQSTGGSDEFEPKLGLVPLLVGTLKGTLYALLVSIPIAVFAALYVSQLASPALRTVIKPTIELMAAMPSVVVGFLAALWLAPLVEGHLGAGLGILVALPIGLAVALAAWYAFPSALRRRARPGVELAFLVPFLVAAGWAGCQLGGPLEARFFAGDLQQWLFDRHGITYDQRNCLVVGIALGFAIIPIIFTISEDAMSAVPRSLTSAALALGASRWQSALHVVLPAASPGIFAAVMLGLGRAIGETMIVLMATGNTPILDLSPFNGMRTMSAGIAVEIPEAPHGGTLYRVLFLTGLLLFCCTFLLNTAADLVGRRLRKRYGQF